MDKPLISIVIPIYNVEKYLKACIDSVINQTYSQLDIILVDDGSKDNSGNMCDEYKNKDSRIRVIHKENGGLSDARNKGIDIALGKYITFIDSDDYVAKDYVEFLYKLIMENSADISGCYYFKFVEEQDQNMEESEKKTYIFDGIEATIDLWYQKHITNSAWGKLYKSILFRDIRYPVGKLYEDLGTTYKLLYKAKNVVWSSEKKYFYRQRVNSIMNKKFAEDNMDRIEMSEELMSFVDKKRNDMYKAAVSRLFISNIQVLRELPLHDYKYANIINKIKLNIKQYRKVVLFDKESKKITRLIAFVSYGPISVVQRLGILYKIIYG